MTVLAEKKPKTPKRVVSAPEPIAQPEPANLAAVLNDPVLASLSQGPKPECTPVSGTVMARQIEERRRRHQDSLVDSANNGKSGKWAFVKNGNVREKITFKDGTEFTFPSTVFITEDEELVKKIREVESLYNICLK
jgi:hypothetical protein